MFERYLKFRIIQRERKSPSSRLTKLIELLYGKPKNSFIKSQEIEESFSDNGLDYFGDGSYAGD